jgi:hypothetical protein
MTSDETPPIEEMAESWSATADDRSARERVYDVATQLTEPTGVGEIADRADCAPNTARDTLEWFAEMGIVTAVGEHPVRYRRNESYFEFLRVDRLASEHTREELDQFLENLQEEEAQVATHFEVDHPEDVSLDETAPDRLEQQYDRLSEWRTLRRRIRDILQAKAELDSRSSGQNDSLPA